MKGRLCLHPLHVLRSERHFSDLLECLLCEPSSVPATAELYNLSSPPVTVPFAQLGCTNPFQMDVDWSAPKAHSAPIQGNIPFACPIIHKESKPAPEEEQEQCTGKTEGKKYHRGQRHLLERDGHQTVWRWVSHALSLRYMLSPTCLSPFKNFFRFLSCWQRLRSFSRSEP